MRKYILPVLLIIAFLFFAFAVYKYSKDNSSYDSDSERTKNQDIGKDSVDSKTNSGSGKNSGESSGNSGSGGASTDSGSSSRGGSGGESSGGSSSEGGGGNSGGMITPIEERTNQSSCILVRPGNIPNVNCFVDYIKKDSISIKIGNKLEENIGISLELDTCSPKIQDSIKSNEQKSFVFSCNNNDYFNQYLLINYTLQQNGNVNVGGFVNGPVSD